MASALSPDAPGSSNANVESVELYSLATGIFKAFQELTDASDASSTSNLERRNYERFRLLSSNLGIHRQGHASLDYRVRDAMVVKARFADILGNLQEHLDNLLSISRGERRPFEEEDGDTGSSAGSSTSADAVSERSDGSFHEVDFRHRSITEALDALYSVATKIRHPRNRPQRTTRELYKHVPPHLREIYIREREAAEIVAVSYLQRQSLLANFDASEPLERYISQESFLVRRIGIANARRKQQFIYWKEHANRISHGPTTDTVLKDPQGKMPQVEETPLVPQQLPGDALQADAPSAPGKSLATSATKLDETQVKLDDLQSVISHQSQASTTMTQRWKIEWPLPPEMLIRNTTSNFFTCPYCHVICPREYLTKAGWKSHIIHDLTPYHCTYERCPDPNRLYGSHQDWLDHEATHTRVWHCHVHASEFETQPEYVQHLQQYHNNHLSDANSDQFAPELIAAAVGPSLQPHRGCPLCPSGFTNVAEMQKHIKTHLERLALFCLPPLDDQDADAVDGSSDSSQVVQGHGGRRDSLEQDFEESELLDWVVGERPDVPEDIPTGEKSNIDGIRRLIQGQFLNSRSSITEWLSELEDRSRPESQHSNWSESYFLHPDIKPRKNARKPPSYSDSNSSSTEITSFPTSTTRALRQLFQWPSSRSSKGGQRRQDKGKRGDYRLSIGNLSSSSIDSDLAYGEGYVAHSKSPTFSHRAGDPSHKHRASDGEEHVDQQDPRASSGKIMTNDQELIAIGRQLSELARQDQHRNEHRHSRRGTATTAPGAASVIGTSMAAPEDSHQKQGQTSSRYFGSSEPHGSAPDDGSAWESASDAGSYLSDDGADSDHKHTHQNSVVGPEPPRPSGLLNWLRGRMKSTAVAPSLSLSDNPEIEGLPRTEWGSDEIEGSLGTEWGSAEIEGSPGIEVSPGTERPSVYIVQTSPAVAQRK